MNLRADPGVPRVDADAVERALLTRKVAMHRANVTRTHIGSFGAALALAAMLHGTLPDRYLLGWLGLLATVLVVRAVIARTLPKDSDDPAVNSAALRKLRIGFLAHGLAWATCAMLPVAEGDALHQAVLVMVATGVMLSSFALTAFDLEAALLFGVPVSLLLSQRLFSMDDPTYWIMGGVLLGGQVFLSLTAGRTYRSMQNYEALRLTEVAQRHALQATSEALTHKTQALQDTLDSISQGIVSFDAAGRVRVQNRRALELLGLPEDLAGADMTYERVVGVQVARGDLAPDGSFLDIEGNRRHACGRHQDLPDCYVRRTPAGALIEVRTRHLADGAMVRTFADVTASLEAQRALRSSEAELRALLGAFPGFIAVSDAHFVYTYVNERFAALMGQSRDAIVGQHARAVLGDERFERWCGLLDGARAGDQYEAEVEYRPTPHGETTWLQVTYAVGLEDATGRRSTYAFALDVSARKEAELALRAAKDEAERANHAKSQFLSSMSHELRTPLNAILGFGQLLLAGATPALADPQRDHVRQILRGGRHLLELINEVLDLAQIETGRLRIALAPVRVAELLQECLTMLRPLARDAGIELQAVGEIPHDGLVQADRTRLKQVLLNLLSNAIKYNRRGGAARVACRLDAGTMRIAVADDGPGLSPDQQARLFQAFERLDAGATAIEGAGLGLVLSRHVMVAMHGEIGLDSEVGRGSTFWITLPRAQAADYGIGAALPALRPARVPGRAAASRTVLYIEDNPVNVMLMAAMLERIEGVRMISAALPALGLQLAAQERPALILLDIQLPGIDGFEVLRRLRLEPLTRDIPVIAVSANAMRGDVEQALASGFLRYLTKPLDLRELAAAVELALPVQE